MEYKLFVNDVWDWFKNSPEYVAMEKTVEDSPWHREANVLVHTTMVTDQFIERQPIEQWNHDDLLCYLACMFHDVGKPACEEHKHSEERGDYRSYGGHEQYSACMFTDIALSNWTLFSRLLTVYDIVSVSWLIQYHLPYKLGKDKLTDMVNTLSLMLSDPYRFKNVLIADQYGRISDNHDTNVTNMEKWFIEQFDPLVTPYISKHDPSKPTCFVLMGPSGSGKSTYIEKLINQQLIEHGAVFSFDLIRYSMLESLLIDKPNDMTAVEQYKMIHAHSVNDGKQHFNDEIARIFAEFMITNKSFVIDNMNLTSKAYKRYTSYAKQKGYNITHVLFPITLDKILDRGIKRGNRGIPVNVLDTMYFKLVLPTINKYCDNIVVVDSNV